MQFVSRAQRSILKNVSWMIVLVVLGLGAQMAHAQSCPVYHYYWDLNNAWGDHASGYVDTIPEAVSAAQTEINTLSITSGSDYCGGPEVFISPWTCADTGAPPDYNIACTGTDYSRITTPQGQCTLVPGTYTAYARYIKMCENPFFVLAKTPNAQVSSDNSAGDPINPAVGNVFRTEEDVRLSGTATVGFNRYYNSADATGADLGPGWRHSYVRSIKVIQAPALMPYPGADVWNTISGAYQTPAQACQSGFATISESIPGWGSATASYANGTCVVSAGTGATIPIYSSLQLPPASTIEFDAIRDDGTTLRYTVQNGTIVNPPGVSLRFAFTSSGFSLTDDQDTVESYDGNGALQSITSRFGVVVGSSRVDLQACKLEYSIVSPK